MSEYPKVSRRGLVRLLYFSLLPIGGACQKRRYSEALPNLFACDEQELRLIGKSAVQHEFSPYELKRSASGDCAYLEQPTPSPGEILVLSARDEPRRLKVPGFYWALADNLTFVAWREGDGLRFGTGELHGIPRLGIPPGLGGSGVGFSPGGSHYFIASGTTSDIFATITPGKRLAVAGLFAKSIFTVGQRILIFGCDATARDLYQREILGEVYAIASGTVRRERSIRIQRPHPEPSPFSVLDVDQQSNTVLCIDIHDLRDPEWLLYDLTSGNLKRLGPAFTFGAFLAADLVQSLYGRLRGEK